MNNSKLTIRCAAPDCTAKQDIEFTYMTEVVDESGSWILPDRWHEEEVDDGKGVNYIICCGNHTVISAPKFVPSDSAPGDPS